MRLLLATRNAAQAARVRAAGRGSGRGPISIDPLPDDVELPPEDGETFAENALGKARAAAAATGRVAIADDSGIEAAALGGAPGVRSARYAGEHASDEREPREAAARGAGGQSARLRLRARLRRPGGRDRARSSRSAARARSRRPRAAIGGFGYDPAFLPDDGVPDRTMAELSDAEKDAISHRGRAVRALLAWLPD